MILEMSSVRDPYENRLAALLTIRWFLPWKSGYAPVSLGMNRLSTIELDGVALPLAAPASALYGVAPGKNEVGIVGIGMAESVPNAVDKSLGMRGAAKAEGVAVAVSAVL